MSQKSMPSRGQDAIQEAGCGFRQTPEPTGPKHPPRKLRHAYGLASYRGRFPLSLCVCVRGGERAPGRGDRKKKEP